jgi:hypothetical protein
MNAPQQAATCPTCKGSGVRTKTWVKWGSDREREKPQRCLACRGSGQVDPLRVCQTCGQWADQCTCPKSKIIKLWKVNEMNGVNWNEKDQRYRVEFSRNGTHYYLGQYADKALAVHCRMEADHTPDDQLPALRKKYAALKQNGNGHVAPEPAETQAFGLSPDEFAVTIAALDQAAPAPADTSTPVWDSVDDLNEKLAAARTAERRYQDALVVLEQAQAQSCEAEQRAIEAWNDLAKALLALGQTEAFDKSMFGRIESPQS